MAGVHNSSLRPTLYSNRWMQHWSAAWDGAVIGCNATGRAVIGCNTSWLLLDVAVQRPAWSWSCVLRASSCVLCAACCAAACCVLCAVRCALCAVRCALCAVRCALCAVRCALCVVRCCGL
jgi:hypothetical protein